MSQILEVMSMTTCPCNYNSSYIKLRLNKVKLIFKVLYLLNMLTTNVWQSVYVQAA